MAVPAHLRVVGLTVSHHDRASLWPHGEVESAACPKSSRNFQAVAGRPAGASSLNSSYTGWTMVDQTSPWLYTWSDQIRDRLNSNHAAINWSVLNAERVSITGVASVIMSPADFDKMKPGTILVCPLTTPAWTQLFPHATGLVTDIGSILAHGSIVAREYGIPAVLGIGDVTRRVKSGQTIEVDGDRGTVKIVASG